jgi:hypothetical protein
MSAAGAEDRDHQEDRPVGGEPGLIDAAQFEAAFGEPLARTLDLDTWHPGEDLAALYARLEMEVAAAVGQEGRVRGRIREVIFPRLRTRPGAPPEAGVWQATPGQLERVHRGLLFSGAVEACDGTSVLHDTLPLTIAQLGACLVSYDGSQGSWVHRLFRRDLRAGMPDPVDEALELLERRRRRAGFDASSPRDGLSELARRGIMTYAERAVLLGRSDAPWRMGHGNPLPHELLTGSGMRELLEASLDLLHRLVLGHRQFVFVPSGPAERMLLTIGNALRPLEYAVVDTLQDFVTRVMQWSPYRSDWIDVVPRAKDFAAAVGSQVAVGVYRASALAPAHVFYAHADHVHEAALIVLADSALQEHRGFPMLLDLADTVCRTTFGADTFHALTQLAYAEAGAPHRYLTERQTRR